MNSSNDAPRPADPAPPPEVVEAAAAAWLSLRDRGMNAAETAEFVRWLQQDPRHAAVFAELDRVWKDFDRLAAVPASTAGDSAPVPDADLLAPRVCRRPARGWRWAALGAVAAAIVLVSMWQLRGPSYTAETAVGAFQRVDLPDGSVAQLNTDSAIQTDFSAGERRVRLARGEVFLNVARDPARPFVVMVGPVAVRAVGTAFNVRRREAAVEVLVTDGRVRVDDAARGESLLASAEAEAEPPVLAAGERAVVAVTSESSSAALVAPAAATVTKVSATEVRRALAWQERRLEFDALPLAEVVREFNRYNRTRLVITDAALAVKRFSGTFRADGYESLVRLLEEDFGVAATRRGREIVLGVRR